MKFNFELLLNILWIATICQVLALVTTQKFKSFRLVRKSWQVILFNFTLNMILSISFCLTFTNLTILSSLWVGFFSFIGADTIYKTLEEKKLMRRLSEFNLYK